jgi:hypothetical protein
VMQTCRSVISNVDVFGVLMSPFSIR